MKVAVVYWSGTGNTKAMAEAMAEGAKSAGADTELFSVDAFAVGQMQDYDGFLFGCPAMGCEVLEEAEFEPFFAEAEGSLKDKPVGLFGSYGWGNGEWLQDWQERSKNAGAKVYQDGVMINNEPDDDGLTQCREFASGFIKANA
ncbi:MAG: flavodoxin [Anaerovibrio sp.]|uniref:flavodoxin n=1 Tax=Anaerovibrio sp. TaxID=1872532 RepID=UPI0025D6E02B|nr:flavodoxin [Anaerovibrio sp.]MCR5177101.1 flavodoxin [Anaerovibrio sp.]